LGDGVAEGVVFVMRDNGTGGVDVVGDVADVVVEGIIENIVYTYREETADATRALEGTGLIFAPNIMDVVRGVVGVGGIIKI